ncbi:MAG: hydrogenase maturation protein HypF, partial [Nocardioidaceae bacterium]|nr:hydrogenase maturation protein HypF [Nocardioidaceae bacterium]
ATELDLTGWVSNTVGGVVAEVEGAPDGVAELGRRLREEPPPLAVVEGVHESELETCGGTGFRIEQSGGQGDARTLPSPDVATCQDCLDEMLDPTDRRHRHPFITCTNCGPRFTIITDLPYDRATTTMAGFAMCPRCQEEYADPGDRRYHAQPISCHDCGPRIWAEGPRVDRLVDRRAGVDEVLEQAQQVLADGGIVAVKGIGGFHLACDATDPDAVARLRDRKHRPDKPFAVMAASEAVAEQLAELPAVERSLLTGPARPIVLLRKLAGSPVADVVAPGLDELGVILPYAPLHHLLFSPTPGSAVTPPGALVMTSGNLTDEPLCSTNDEARIRLSAIADLLLMHDRDIAIPCEDSVLAVCAGAELAIRRSRGFAPLPVQVPDGEPVTLAVGAEVKNTFCVSRHGLAFCSAHLGDMGGLDSRQAFDASVRHLTTLHDARPELVVADDHPGYATRTWAEHYSEDTGTPLLTVQHHHAHVASLLAEHGLVGTPVVGVAYDGTGFGCDRTVWGGEILHVGTDVTEMERVGHLEPFLLPGGDRAVRNPFRVAISLLHSVGVDDPGLLRDAGSDDERALVCSQLVTGTACATTTSVGRLFDGVASLLGVRHTVTYEAQAAIELEALARSAAKPVELPLDVVHGTLRLGSLVRALVIGVRTGQPVEGLALGFHQALAGATAVLVTDLAAARGVGVVGLTGGVFQNRLLVAALVPALEDAGLRVLTHRRVPPNDGGLSLGQAVLGRARAAARGLGARSASTAVLTGGGA